MFWYLQSVYDDALAFGSTTKAEGTKKRLRGSGTETLQKFINFSPGRIKQFVFQLIFYEFQIKFA